MPQPAATVVLARDAADGPEVLLLQRNARVAFMASAWVFPGGRVDPQDHDPRLGHHIRGAEATLAQNAAPPSADLARALVATAVRECLEEAGVLLARGDDEAIARVRAERERLAAGEVEFAALLEASGLVVNAADLPHYAHWITPPFERRRYDTYFFVARAPADQLGVHDDGETVASRWVRPAEAVELSAAGEITLPPPTLRSLHHMSAFDSVDALLAWAHGQHVRAIEPALHDADGDMWLVFPGHPAHPAPWAVDAPRAAELRDGRWWLRE